MEYLGFPSKQGIQNACNGFTQHCFSSAAYSIKNQTLRLLRPSLPVIGSKLVSIYCTGRLTILASSSNSFLNCCTSPPTLHSHQPFLVQPTVDWQHQKGVPHFTHKHTQQMQKPPTRLCQACLPTHRPLSCFCCEAHACYSAELLVPR